MKKIFISVALLALPFFGAMAQSIVATNQIIDCGQVLYQTPATFDFEVKNKSNKPVRITDVCTSCGCTDVAFPREAIAAGEKFTISITYDAATMGHFDKLVGIYNEGDDKPLLLRVRGSVVREVVDYGGNYNFMLGSIKSDCNDVEFDDVNRGDRPQKKIHIFNSTSAAVQPVVMHLPEYLKADVSPSNIAPGHGGVITMTLDSHKLDDMGLTQTSVFLGAFPGDKVNREKEIGISAVLLPKFDNLTAQQLANAPQLYLSTTELNLGHFDQKKKLKGEIVIRNDGKSVLKIKSLQMFTVGLQVSLNKQTLHPGESAKLKVTAEKRQLKTARSKPRVLMITNDPKQPKTTIKIVAE